MPARAYRLGRREASVGRTRTAVLAAARDLLAAAPAADLSVGAVAARAGVSRLTVYHHFGSRARLLEAVAPAPAPASGSELLLADPMEIFRARIQSACSRWSADPALYRHLPASARDGGPEAGRGLAERLAAADRLRPGCSIKEAQDVIGVLTSFETFDRLHQDGRRAPAAVAEILMRLAGAILG